MKKAISVDVRMINSSGIGRYIKNILPYLIKNLTEVDFKLIGNKAELNRFDWANCPNTDIIDYNASIYSISEQIGLLNKIPNNSDLFWAPHYNIPIFYKGKMLVTVHDVIHLALPEYAKGFKKQFYSKTLFNILKNKAESILTVSEFSKNELIRVLKVKPSKIHTILNGIDNNWFNIKKGDRPHKNPYFLYVGNVKPHKNLKTLIEAFKLIKEKIPQDIVIVGKKDGFIYSDDEVVNDSDNLSRVIFTGHVSDDLLKQYFAHADAFIFPSFYEGFGLPPLEAMACNCPVISSNAASLPEVCSNAALYFNPKDKYDLADKIVQFVNDKNLKQTLIDRGLKQAQKFSWNKASSQIGDVILSLL